jgi:hypothetical protein
MFPTVSAGAAQARIAELRQQAERASLARAARRARPTRSGRPASRESALGRRARSRPSPQVARAARDTELIAARPRPATVALIAVDDRIRPWRLSAWLGAALEAHLSVAVLSGAEIPAAAVAGEPAGTYGPLLDRAEAGHDVVLLTGGLSLDEPWTKFCLQQADRILAMTGGGPVPPALRTYPELKGCDLVAYDAAPEALDGWATALDPADSHLVRETQFGADVARMARRLAGASVGLVLSGGGARALSHVGALEELTAAE